MIPWFFECLLVGAANTFLTFQEKAGVIGIVIFFGLLLVAFPLFVLLFFFVGIPAKKRMERIKYAEAFYRQPLNVEAKTFKEHLINNFNWGVKSFDTEAGFATIDLDRIDRTAIIRPFKKSKKGCVIPFPEALKGIKAIKIPSYLWMEEIIPSVTNFDYWTKQHTEDNPPLRRLNKDDWFTIKECVGKMPDPTTMPYILLEDESGREWKFNYVIFAYAQDLKVRYDIKVASDELKAAEIIREMALQDPELMKKLIEFDKKSKALGIP